MINTFKATDNTTQSEHFKSGAIIIHDGDAQCENMYILLDGIVDVYKNYDQPNEVKVTSLKEGDFFGEMSLFLGRSRNATVVAATDVKAFSIDRESALSFFQSQPEATFSLIRELCARLADTNNGMADNSTEYVKNVNILNKEKEVYKTAANTDALTGVFNRRYFMEAATSMVGDALGRGGNVYISVIDLDFFKKVNDTYGHQAGDETLKVAAKTITSVLRDDDLFARYGGEEFILLITRVTQEHAEALIERVRSKIQETVIEFEDHKINVTASFGVSEVTSTDGIEAAIARADEGLYRAKEGGRNRFVFN